MMMIGMTSGTAAPFHGVGHLTKRRAAGRITPIGPKKWL